MGCCLSSRSASATKNVRVVHLNGYVEDFAHPVLVGQLTGKPPKYFVSTAALLLSNSSKPVLKPDKLLEPGHVYLLLPYSTLQSDVSPVDLASLVRKLTAKAKSGKFETKSPKADLVGSSLSPSSIAPAGSAKTLKPQIGVIPRKEQMVSRRGPWRPILETIREWSFNRGSESDLQEMQVESMK